MGDLKSYLIAVAWATLWFSLGGGLVYAAVLLAG